MDLSQAALLVRGRSSATLPRVIGSAAAAYGGVRDGRGERCAPSDWAGAAASQLAEHRALGFKLKEEGRLLGQLVSHLEAAGAETVSTEVAIQWARLAAGVHPNHWSKRLRVARGFAAYLQTLDSRTEIPSPDNLTHRRQRATPYLFCDEDIRRLMAEARQLRNPTRAASHEALFGPPGRVRHADR